jgi:hypothetical protein
VEGKQKEKTTTAKIHMDWEGWLTSHLKDGGCALYLPQLSSL